MNRRTLALLMSSGLSLSSTALAALPTPQVFRPLPPHPVTFTPQPTSTAPYIGNDPVFLNQSPTSIVDGRLVPYQSVTARVGISPDSVISGAGCTQGGICTESIVQTAPYPLIFVQPQDGGEASCTNPDWFGDHVDVAPGFPANSTIKGPSYFQCDSADFGSQTWTLNEPGAKYGLDGDTALGVSSVAPNLGHSTDVLTVSSPVLMRVLFHNEGYLESESGPVTVHAYGRVCLYITDETAGGVMVSMPCQTAWSSDLVNGSNSYDTYGSLGIVGANGWMQFDTPLTASIPNATVGHSYNIWVWAETSSDAGFGEYMNLDVPNISWGWAPQIGQ
jgi:hypothetical protein